MECEMFGEDKMCLELVNIFCDFYKRQHVEFQAKGLVKWCFQWHVPNLPISGLRAMIWDQGRRYPNELQELA